MSINPRWAFIPKDMLATGEGSQEVNERTFASILAAMEVVAKASPRPALSEHVSRSERLDYASRIYQQPIDDAAYRYLLSLNCRYQLKKVCMTHMHEDRIKSEKRLEMFLTEHLRIPPFAAPDRLVQFTVRIVGEPDYQCPLHEQIGKIYAGDEMTLVNNCVLIRRRKIANEKHCGVHNTGYYLVPTSF